MNQRIVSGLLNRAFIVPAILFALGAAIFLGFNVTHTKASSSSPTGSCGFLLTRSLFGYDAYLYNSPPVGTAINGIMNYDAGTFSGKITLINNYGLSNAYDSTDYMTGTITSTPSASIPSTYVITLNYTGTGSNTGSGTIQFLDTLTNGGTTGMLKSVPVSNNNSGAWTGYCIAL
jgi:hypothetical protein